MVFSSKSNHPLSAYLPMVHVFVVAFRGEDVILLGRRDYEADWKNIPHSEKELSLPCTTLVDGVSEIEATQDVLSNLGQRGTAVGLRFVDRHYLDRQAQRFFNGELCLIYTCDYCGYFNGCSAKPSALPQNLPAYQADIVRKVAGWRDKRERHRATLERLIKDLAGTKDAGDAL